MTHNIHPRTVKAKFAYFLLILGILALLAAGAAMSQYLFDMSVPETDIATLEKPSPAPRETIPVAEKIVEVGTPPPAPAAPAATAPPAAAHRPSPPPAAAKQKTTPRPASRAPIPVVTRVSGSTPAPAATDDTEARGIGKVVSINGTAYAIDDRGRRRVLALESWVFADDRIDTDQQTRLTIKFRDGSTLSQGESTTIVVDRYVYDPRNCNRSCFAVRFIRGVCRVITGAIADLNPDRFDVKTRMATVGIRGCDLAFRTTLDRDDIYVIDLAGKRLVRINTTSNGSRLVNVLTGNELEVDETKRTVIDITEPNSAVYITRGKGFTREKITLEDVRQISAETSLLSPARPKVLQSADGVVFTVQPNSSTPPKAPDQAK